MPNRIPTQNAQNTKPKGPPDRANVVHFAFDVEDAVNAAYEEAIKSGLPGANGGPQDAYRHLLITAEMIRQHGEKYGSELAETNEIFSMQPGKDAAMDRHNNALARDIGKKAETWDDLVRRARKEMDEAARHGGDGKDGRVVWHKKPDDPNWKPDWKNRPAGPNLKGGKEHRHKSNTDPDTDTDTDKKQDGGQDSAPAAPAAPEGGKAGQRSEAPGLGDRDVPSAAALEAAEDGEANAGVESDSRAARAMVDRIANTRETVDEILNKPVQAVTEDEIDRVIASDNAMIRGHVDSERANDFVTDWFRRVFGGLHGNQQDIADSRMAQLPIPAPAPGGGTVQDGVRRIGSEVLKDASAIGLRPAVAKLQDGLNSSIHIGGGSDLFRDGEFGPKTAERLRQAVARQGTGNVLDAVRRAVPPERI